MMKIKGLLFDLNGTVIDILTNEADDQLFRVCANFLDYYGVKIDSWKLKELYFELNHEQRSRSLEKFPEFDVAEIFREIIKRYSHVKVKNPSELAKSAAVVFRAASRFQLQLYPLVSETLEVLQKDYKMAALSDGQTLWAVPELTSLGLDKFFSAVLVSGDYGFRKPDPRFFEMALKKMRLTAEEVIFIGNDMYRDVYGAANAGMKTVFFKSNQGDHSYRGVDPDYIIYNFNELLQAVDFLQSRN